MADIPNILDFSGVSVSSDDDRPGDLEAKIAAGTDITLTTLNPGANEQLEISASGGGQVNTVVGGDDITVDATDPVNPIVNLDASITATVNGVILTTAGVATNFLDETGAYSVPAGGAASFTSAEQTITAAGALTLAHGLTGTPTQINAYLVNKTAEHGYSIGDFLAVDVGQQSTSAVDNLGLSIVPDGTNLNIRFGSNAITFLILNKTTGASANLTDANWNIVFEAQV